MLKRALILSLAFALSVSTASAADKKAKSSKSTKNPVVVLNTSKGEIKIELYPDKAPISVKNFIDYVNAKHYDGTIFHRVIPGFMIQGGGMTKDLEPQAGVKAPIKNEAGNGLKNEVGTVAMARTGVVDSATDQFFINVKNNEFLDHRDDTQQGYGYAVFGKVIDGMNHVTEIENVQTTTSPKGYRDVPAEAVVIKTARMAK